MGLPYKTFFPYLHYFEQFYPLLQLRAIIDALPGHYKYYSYASKEPLIWNHFWR